MSESTNTGHGSHKGDAQHGLGQTARTFSDTSTDSDQGQTPTTGNFPTGRHDQATPHHHGNLHPGPSSNPTGGPSVSNPRPFNQAQSSSQQAGKSGSSSSGTGWNTGAPQTPQNTGSGSWFDGTATPQRGGQVTNTNVENPGSPQGAPGASSSEIDQFRDHTPTGVKLGKGLDVGTANLVTAVQNEQGGITIKMERNAFIDIDADVYSKRMLTKLQVPYVIHNDRMIVLGDSAFELSNIFGRETRRPMKDGLISPSEVDALGIIRLIIDKIIGPPRAEGEKCYFSVPASSIDRANNVVYHQGLFDGLLRKMGYTPHAMNEAHAVVFSELADQNFTGIGISCGGGMFNVAVAYKTIPALTFSICRGGDWIDTNVANVLGIPASKATAIKERGCDLMNPRNREEEAVVIYYRNLINYTLANIKQKFEVASDMPEFPEPIDIVFSGGTSMIGGFVELCEQELHKIRFPIPVNRVRRAKDPLSSVARGCLIAAAIGE